MVQTNEDHLDIDEGLVIERNVYRRIIKLYKEASYQSHYDHFDRTSGGGAGCPECIRASKLRKEAERLIELYEISLEPVEVIANEHNQRSGNQVGDPANHQQCNESDV